MTTTNQLLINGEDYLLNRHYKTLLNKLVDPAMREFNYDEYSAKEIKAEALVNLLQTLPMMSDSRTVVIKGFSHYNKDELAILTKYFENPNPQTNTIFITDKIDKRSSFYKAYRKTCEVVEFKAPYDNQVPAFIQKESESMGLNLEPGAANLIFDSVGNNLMTIVSELEKLKLYVSPDNYVSKQNVYELIGSGFANVFTITNLLGKKDYARVANVFYQLIEQGEPVMRLISLIIRHYKKLLMACDANTMSQNEMAKIIGVHPFFVKDYTAQLRYYKRKDLQGIYKRLLDLSLDMRSNGAKPETLVKNFIQQVCLS